MSKILLSTVLVVAISGCNDQSKQNYQPRYPAPGRDQDSKQEVLNALKTDNAQQISALLSSGKLSVYDRMPNGDSLLHAAIKHKAEKSARVILEKKNYYFDPADLDEALDQGLTSLVKTMIEKGGDFWVNENFIERVAKNGNTELFQWLENRMGTGYKFSKLGNVLSRYMKAACEKGHVGIVKILLQKGAELTASDLENLKKHQASFQLTETEFADLVEKAISKNHANTVKALFALPHNLSQQQLNDLYPKHPVFRMEDSLKELIDHGVRVTVEQCQEAFECHMHSLVQKMIETKAVNVNERPYGGKTMLYFAVEKNDAGLVELLLKHGARPSINDTYNGQTPLDKRISDLEHKWSGYDRILSALCARGAISTSAKYTCSNGWTKKEEKKKEEHPKSEPKSDYAPPPQPDTRLSLEDCVKIYSEHAGFKKSWDSRDLETRKEAYKKAFRALTKIYHPDMPRGNKAKWIDIGSCNKDVFAKSF